MAGLNIRTKLCVCLWKTKKRPLLPPLFQCSARRRPPCGRRPHALAGPARPVGEARREPAAVRARVGDAPSARARAVAVVRAQVGAVDVRDRATSAAGALVGEIAAVALAQRRLQRLQALRALHFSRRTPQRFRLFSRRTPLRFRLAPPLDRLRRLRCYLRQHAPARISQPAHPPGWPRRRRRRRRRSLRLPRRQGRSIHHHRRRQACMLGCQPELRLEERLEGRLALAWLGLVLGLG